MRPPASGPTMMAMPPHAVHEPIAAPRSRSGNAATMIASELGASSAPAAPCKARAAISVSTVGATAHAARTPRSHPGRSRTRGACHRCRRASRRSGSTIRVSTVYAFEIHCCACNPPPRSSWIAGSATLTIVPSIAAMLEPRIAATSVRRCVRVTALARCSRAAKTRPPAGTTTSGGRRPSSPLHRTRRRTHSGEIGAT